MQFQTLTALLLLLFLNSAIASPAPSPQLDLDLDLDLNLDPALDPALGLSLSLSLNLNLSRVGITNGGLCAALYTITEKNCVAGTEFDEICTAIAGDRVLAECRREIIELIESNK